MEADARLMNASEAAKLRWEDPEYRAKRRALMVARYADGKVCIGCKVRKPVGEFRPRTKGKSRLQSRCVPCHRDHSLRYKWLKLYGLTWDAAVELLESVSWKCEICSRSLSFEGKAFDSPCIDHNHTSGLVRGVLCRTCNLALGQFGDSLEVIGAAIKYLERTNG